MNRPYFASAALAATLSALGMAQTAEAPPAAAAAATPAPAPPPTAWSYKGFNFSGYMDSYYINNFNDPSSRTTQAQAFNFTSDKLSLNSFTGSISYDPKPVGFRIDAGYGRTYDAFYLSEPRHTDWARYLLNAYVSLKPASWKGVQFDFGKFVTSAGAEVTESHLNWNYSRSLLFAYGPYYHFGLRATVPVRPNWSVGGQLIQGWNNILDNNHGKSFGITSLNTWSKVTLANNYYAGPENNGTTTGWRNFYDFVLTATPTSKISAYVNVDTGHNAAPGNVGANFWGIAGAARFALFKNFAISPRLEYYCDCDGYWTGTPMGLKEGTITGEFKLNESMITRLEWRHDWSDKPFFQKGLVPGSATNQTQLTASVIMVLKPGLFDFSGWKSK